MRKTADCYDEKGELIPQHLMPKRYHPVEFCELTFESAEAEEYFNILNVPAEDKFILKSLGRLAVHKAAAKDDKLMSTFLQEYTSYILAESATKYQVVLLIEYFICYDENEFFPKLSKLLNALKVIRNKNFIDIDKIKEIK